MKQAKKPDTSTMTH